MEQQEEQEKEISLRSEDFQEILGNVPSWILRCGISILAIIIVVLLIGCSLFKYPDVISVPMTLTSLQPVAGIVSKSTGKLQKIFVKDKQIVTQGTHLAIIENVANMSDIQYLKHFLTENAWGIDSVLLPQKSINVGELQSLYSAYYIALSEYIQFRKQNYYPQKIEMTQKKIYHSNIYYQKLIQQQKIVNQQLRISKKQYQRDYELKEKK